MLRWAEGVALLLPWVLFSTGCSSLKNPLDFESNIKSKSYAVESLWVRSPEGVNREFRRSHRMQPVVTDEFVVQGNAYDGISAFDRRNGQRRWFFSVENGIEGGAQVFSETVYFGGGDARFYALSLETGEKIWEFKLGSQVLASPLVTEGYVFFLSGNNTLYALDRKTGRQKWLYRRAQTTNLTVRGGSQPVLDSTGRLLVGMADGYLVAVNARDGGLIWERPLLDQGRFIDVDATPVLSDGHVFVASYDGALFCLDGSDGQVVWVIEEGGATGVSIEGSVAYYSTSQGQVLALDKKSGKKIWSYQVPSGIATLPKFHKGLLLFGESDGPFRFLAANTGVEVAAYDTGRGVSGEPNVTPKGEVFFVSNQGYLYGLKVSRKVREQAWSL